MKVPIYPSIPLSQSQISVFFFFFALFCFSLYASFECNVFHETLGQEIPKQSVNAYLKLRLIWYLHSIA